MNVLDPGVAQQALVQAARELDRSQIQDAERPAELAVGGLAVVACALLWLLPATGGFDLVGALVCAAGLLVAAKVRFEVGVAYTVPAQLALVPLFFAVPAQAVPLAVIVVILAGRMRAVTRGDVPPARLAVELGNAWYAIGASLALVAVGGPHAVIHQPLLAVPVVAGQFAGDLAASVLREAFCPRVSLRTLLGEAAWVYAVDAVLTLPPLWMVVHGAGVAGSALVLLPFVGLLAVFAHERTKRLDSLFELNNAYHGTALLLGDVVEADDNYTAEHSRGVVRLALDVGDELRLDDARMRHLEFSALLHDVGKVAIPKEIINKPGKLDPREWEIVKTHTVEGQRMLDQVGGFMADVGRIVRSHHERWDGAGYPDRLAGEAIPLEARIVTACDSFSAMTTDRAYRSAMSVAAALAELERNAGSQFDPRIVAALIAVISRSEPSPRDPVTLAA